MKSTKTTLRYTKTVEIELLVDNCVIVDFKMSGDFFTYPEEAVDFLEEKIKGCNTPTCISEVFKEVFADVAVLGFDVSDLEKRVIEIFTDVCKGNEPL